MRWPIQFQHTVQEASDQSKMFLVFVNAVLQNQFGVALTPQISHLVSKLQNLPIENLSQEAGIASGRNEHAHFSI